MAGFRVSGVEPSDYATRDFKPCMIVVTIHIICFNIKRFKHFVHKMYLRISCSSWRVFGDVSEIGKRFLNMSYDLWTFRVKNIARVLNKIMLETVVPNRPLHVFPSFSRFVKPFNVSEVI
jgi:hypothetical protein